MKTDNPTVIKNRHHSDRTLTNYSELADFLAILQLLIREPSVVGCEDSFFRVLSRELEEIGVEVEYYYGVLVARGR
jgi:hypothetical protein